MFEATVSLNQNKASFSWTDNSGAGDAAATDLAMLLVYNKAKSISVYGVAVATRGDAKAELVLPTSWSNDALAVYLGFRDADGTSAVNSLCLQDTPVDGSSEGGDSGNQGTGDGGKDDDPLG